MKKLLLGLLLCGCGDKADKVLFTPKPECMGDAVVPYSGTFPQVINTLAIGSVADGFDLDGDGKPDNKLAAVASLAMSSISDAVANYEIIIPLEYFDFPTVETDGCVKFAIYLGAFDTDKDGDTKRPGIKGGDCNDNDPTIYPGATEIVGDGKDNDCDGLADEDGQNNPNTTDMLDRDHDGQTVAQGDCDDTDPTVGKGFPEICGDGKDNDCDGVADRSTDASGNVTACSPFDTVNLADITLDPLSFNGTDPVIAFKSGAVDSSLNLLAGPSIFSVNIPVTDGITLDLQISGATIEATLSPDGTTMNGKLGGVLDAKTMDTVRGLNVSQIGLTPDDSLLDATFANLLGPLLALPKAASADIQKKYPGCRTPDIDVDGDGLEAFCDSDPNDDNKTVDVCIDGDGTEIHDTLAADGTTIQCTTAVDSNGKFRFVDGVSVELNFTTTRIKSIKPPAAM